MIELSFDKDLHEKANENHNEVSMATVKLTKKSTSGKCWRGCGEKGPFYTVDENVNQCSHYGEHNGNEYLGLISFRMDWLDLLAVQGALKSSKASIL